MLVKPRPFPHKTPCPRGPDLPSEEFPREIERRQLSLVLNMKVRWIVIVEEHSNDDSKKRRDHRHRYMLPPAPSDANEQDLSRARASDRSAVDRRPAGGLPGEFPEGRKSTAHGGGPNRFAP